MKMHWNRPFFIAVGQLLPSQYCLKENRSTIQFSIARSRVNQKRQSSVVYVFIYNFISSKRKTNKEFCSFSLCYARVAMQTIAINNANINFEYFHNVFDTFYLDMLFSAFHGISWRQNETFFGACLGGGGAVFCCVTELCAMSGSVSSSMISVLILIMPCSSLFSIVTQESRPKLAFP